MNRETWIPIASLAGLFLAGTVMLYATSGPPAPPQTLDVATKAVQQGNKAKAKAPPLVTRTPVEDRAAAPEGAKNVLLVVLSAARRDQLTPYGGPDDLTPWFRSLSEEGARFDDLIVSGGWSKTALITLATGYDALALDLVEPTNKAGNHRVPPRIDTLAERLATAGWYTMGVNAVPPGGKASGLAQGFDHFRDTTPGGFTPKQRLAADDAVRLATQMLRQRRPAEAERPFFLQLNLVDLHKPLKVPPKEFEPWRGPDHEIAPYRAVLNRVDRALATLDTQLGNLGLTDDTYVVVVGAVGEGLSMPEHHGAAHGRNLYPSTAQVPWIVRGPGVERGGVITGVASQLDVLPTILGLVGLPTPEGLPGSDWSAQVRQGGATTRTHAFADTWYSAANRAAVYTTTHACIKDFGSARLEEEGWADGCYDRRSDPTFVTRTPQPELMARLDAWRAETPGSAEPADGP